MKVFVCLFVFLSSTHITKDRIETRTKREKEEIMSS